MYRRQDARGDVSYVHSVGAFSGHPYWDVYFMGGRSITVRAGSREDAKKVAVTDWNIKHDTKVAEADIVIVERPGVRGRYIVK